MTAERTLAFCPMIFLGTFLFSLGVNLLYPTPPAPDAKGYELLGWNLASAHGYSLSTTSPFQPTAHREPFYPWIISLFYRVLGRQPIPMILLQCLLHALMACWTFTFLHRRAGDAAAWTGAALIGIDPALTNYCGAFLTELLASFLLLGSVLLFTQTLTRYRMGFYFATAVICALLTLTRSAFLFFPLGLLLFTFFSWENRPRWRRVCLALIFLGIYSAPLAAWGLRNKIRLDVYTLTNRPGVSLWYRAARCQYNAKQMMTYVIACVVSDKLARKIFPEAHGATPTAYLDSPVIQGNERSRVLTEWMQSDLLADRLMAREAWRVIR